MCKDGFLHDIIVSQSHQSLFINRWGGSLDKIQHYVDEICVYLLSLCMWDIQTITVRLWTIWKQPLLRPCSLRLRKRDRERESRARQIMSNWQSSNSLKSFGSSCCLWHYGMRNLELDGNTNEGLKQRSASGPSCWLTLLHCTDGVDTRGR